MRTRAQVGCWHHWAQRSTRNGVRAPAIAIVGAVCSKVALCPRQVAHRPIAPLSRRCRRGSPRRPVSRIIGADWRPATAAPRRWGGTEDDGGDSVAQRSAVMGQRPCPGEGRSRCRSTAPRLLEYSSVSRELSLNNVIGGFQIRVCIGSLCGLGLPFGVYDRYDAMRAGNHHRGDRDHDAGSPGRGISQPRIRLREGPKDYASGGRGGVAAIALTAALRVTAISALDTPDYAYGAVETTSRKQREVIKYSQKILGDIYRTSAGFRSCAAWEPSRFCCGR